MKTNGDDSNGGTLCGLPGAVCTSGDWREAYANYLIQYVHFYAQEGIKITDLGFTNEPEIARKYATMQLDHRQAVDLAKVVGRAVQQSKLDLNVVCCDSLDWNLQAGFTAALEADPLAASCVAVHSAHQYGFPGSDLVASPPVPLPTRKSAWMTEWSPDVDGKGWNEAWDDCQLTDGIRVAEHIHDCLTLTRANAYFYWFGASTGGTRAFVQINGDGYRVSKRLWAMAAFSRFVRPGAVRVAVSSPHDLLKVTAFENVNSTAVIELLNLSGEALHLELKIDGWPGRVHASSYVTSQDHSLVQAGVLLVSRGTISVNIAPRTLLTLVGER